MSRSSHCLAHPTLAILVWSLLSCATGPGEPQGEGPRTDTLVIGTAVDATGVNQLTGAHSRFSQDVIDLLFLHLFEEQPDFARHPPTFRPQIVKTHSWSDDNLVLNLELRDDIRWSDGVPLTADDIEWTLEAQTHPAIGWSYAHSKEAIESIEVLGRYRLAVRFSRIYSSRLADLNQGVIMPRHAWGELPFDEWHGNAGWFLDNLVVSGPYTVARWRPQAEIVLERNPRFYRKQRPRTRRVVFRVIPERSQRVRQLLAGHLDFVEQLQLDDLPLVASSKRAQPLSYWHRQYTHIVWNGCREPFSDPRVRRALTLAIDRRAIVEALLGHLARVGVSPIPQSIWAFNNELRPWPYDPVRARRLLADAGWRDHDGDGILDRQDRSLSFDLTTNADNRLRVDAGLMIQSQLDRIGVEARMVTLEFNTLVDLNIEHDFDATIAAWGIDTSLDLSYAFHSDSAEGGYNYGCYNNVRVDALIDGVRRQSQIADAAPMLDELQAIIHREQPYTFLWEPRRVDGASNRLRGARPNALSAFYGLEEWRLVTSGG